MSEVDIRSLPAKKSAGHFLGCLKMEDVQKCRYIQNRWVLKSQSYHLKLSQKEGHVHISMRSPSSQGTRLTTSAIPMLWARGWAWRGLTAITVFMAPNSAGGGRALYRWLRSGWSGSHVSHRGDSEESQGPSKQDRLHRFHKARETRARFGRISKTLLAGGGQGQPGQIEWCVQRGRAAWKTCSGKGIISASGNCHGNIKQKVVQGQKARLVRKERLGS